MKILSGFSLVELAIVIAIIALLSAIAIPNLTNWIAKTKRTEAYVNLRALAMAQQAYHAEHGKYTTALTGSDSLDWQPKGNLNYTYGFPGTEGHNYTTGALKTPASHLKNAKVTSDGFVIVAAGDIKNNNKPDILSIDQTGKITITQDALAS